MEQSPLDGLRVLVLEDEFLIAMDIEQLCRDHGAADVAIAAALETLSSGDLVNYQYDIAVVDLRLRNVSTLDFARSLLARGIPFVFATGFSDDSELARDFPTVQVVNKPYRGPDLVEAMVRARNGISRDETR